jgi:hypothetical protein
MAATSYAVTPGVCQGPASKLVLSSIKKKTWNNITNFLNSPDQNRFIVIQLTNSFLTINGHLRILANCCHARKDSIHCKPLISFFQNYLESAQHDHLYKKSN